MNNEELVYWKSNHPSAIRSLVAKYNVDEMLIDDIEQEVFYRLLNSNATFSSFSPYYYYCKKTVAELMDKHFSRESKFVPIDSAINVTGISYPDPDNLSKYYVWMLKKKNPDLLTYEEWRILYSLVAGRRFAKFRDSENYITYNNFTRKRKSIIRKLSAFDKTYYNAKQIINLFLEGNGARKIAQISGWPKTTVVQKIKPMVEDYLYGDDKI